MIFLPSLSLFIGVGVPVEIVASIAGAGSS